MNESDLKKKLAKIEALFAGATTTGEQGAAEQAIARIKARMEEMQKSDPAVEYKFSLNNMWSKKLLMALLRRYGVTPYRYARQRYTTVVVKAPASFIDEILWPEFEKLDAVMTQHLTEITDRIISESIYADTSEAEVLKETKSLS